MLSKNVAATFARQMLAAMLNLITIALIARFYGPEGNGTFAVAMLLPSMLAAFLNLGVAPANVYHLGIRRYTARKVLAANLRIFLLFGLLGLAVGAVALGRHGERLFPEVDSMVLWFALAVFPVSLLNGYLQSIFQGLQEFRPFNSLAVTQPALLLVLVVVLILFGDRNVAWLIAAQLVAVLVVLGLTVLLLRPYLGDRKPADRQLPVTETLGYGWKAHLSNMLAFLNYKADVFLVNFFIGPAAAGVYVVSVAMAEKLWMMSQAVSTVLLPRLAELAVDENKRRVLTPLIARWVLAITLLAALVVAVLAELFIWLVFGEDYSSALLPLWLLLPGIVLGSASRVLANDIAARGRPEWNMYTSFVVVVVNVLGNIALIPLYGLSGAAAATTIAYTLNFGLRLMIYGRASGNRWMDSVFMRFDDLKMLRSALLHG